MGGRVQWDPARNIMASDDGKLPDIISGHRAIQIGLKGRLSEQYVKSIITIQDVTELAHQVGLAHGCKSKEAMTPLLPSLPVERPYMPSCSKSDLVRLLLLASDKQNKTKCTV